MKETPTTAGVSNYDGEVLLIMQLTCNLAVFVKIGRVPRGWRNAVGVGHAGERAEREASIGFMAMCVAIDG
jgi:hypothetical protein